MSKVTAEQAKAWEDIVTRKYADQAIWFLNGFWDEIQGDAEKIWGYVELMAELDEAKKADGNELDEFWSHKFLERIGRTMTVIKMREEFRTIDVDFNKKMSMTEFLGYTYKKTIQQIIDAPQGNNQELIDAAQQQVDAAQAAVDEMVAKLNIATEKANEAKAAADEATRASDAANAAAEEATRKSNAADAAAAEASAKAADAKAAADAAEAVAAPYRKAVAENEAALEELRAQEKAYADKKASLEATKNDMSIGIVKRNKAANELDQLLAEDPLPLQRAKINQAATVRKMEKAAKPFNEASAKANAAAEVAAAAKAEADATAAAAAEAKAQADAAAQAAAEAKAEAEARAQAAAEAKAEADARAQAAAEAKAAAEAAVAEAEAMLQAAMDALEAAKKAGGVAHGAIWWMERQIEEKRRYMPGYKGPLK